MTVDIGVEAINRPTTMYSGVTMINAGGPASIGGQVRSIDLWASANMLSCRVAIFYLVSGTTYKVRSRVVLGNVSSGFHTFNELTLAVEPGDLIGMYYYSGTMERSAYLEDGLYYAAGDRTGVGAQTDFTEFAADDAVSLGGYITPTLGLAIQLMTDILTTSAKANGTVTTLGETPCTQHGHCWSTSSDPTIADDKTELGAVASIPHAFESTLTDLLPSTIYYVRTYATDGDGTVYSDAEKSFRTSTPPPVVWRDEAALPFTPSGQIYFSPIISGEVYVIDQGTNFYKYSLATREWTELTSPEYGGYYYRSLALSPDGTMLACCSYPATGGGLYPTSGCRRIEIYNISADSWTASSFIPDIHVYGFIGGGHARTVVWKDNNAIWVWAIENNGSASGWGCKCLEYTISTDTFTVLAGATEALGRLAGQSNFGYGAAIKADGSKVYASTFEYPYYFIEYDVAGDTYTKQAIAPLLHHFAFAADRDGRLWLTNTYPPDTDGRQGYLLISDLTFHYNIYPENTEKESSDYGLRFGVSADLLLIIANARSIPPELMSYGVMAPTVTTDPATGIGADAAAPNGILDYDGGEACDCGFEWGETIAYGNTTPTQSRTTEQTFAQTISGLDPNKTYHFRAFATNAAGTSHGTDRTFTTLVALSTVTTDPATGVGMVLADFNGTLDDDGGEACDCGFEWGETVAYGNTTPTQSKNTGEIFSQAISGLTPGTTYHFRALATNMAGTSYGADRTFTTYSVSGGGGSRGYSLSRHEL